MIHGPKKIILDRAKLLTVKVERELCARQFVKFVTSEHFYDRFMEVSRYPLLHNHGYENVGITASVEIMISKLYKVAPQINNMGCTPVSKQYVNQLNN